MKKVQSFLKKHKKKLIIIIVLFVALFVMLFALYQIYVYLTPDQRQSVYGDRCEVTESIAITEDRKKGITAAIETFEKMKVAEINVKCNLIDIVIEVEDDVPVTTVKEMSKKVLEQFTDEELKYYEIELAVDSNVEKSDIYPIYAKKHQMINGKKDDYKKFVW